MKKVVVLLVGMAFVLCVGIQVQAATISGDILYGNSWAQAFITDYNPNVINLWSSGATFENRVDGLPSGWTFRVSADGLFMQLYTKSAPAGNFISTWWWNDPKPGAFYLDWQELTYDWSSGDVAAFHEGGLKGYWSVVDYGLAGGPQDPPAIPEPGTLILLGSGLLGLVAVGRKKFRK